MEEIKGKKCQVSRVYFNEGLIEKMLFQYYIDLC